MGALVQTRMSASLSRTFCARVYPPALYALILCALLLAPGLLAGPRTSVNYNVTTDSIDTGGKRATSTSYTNDGSLGSITGVSTVATPAEIAKHGYIGQLTEVTALQLTASPMPSPA